MKKLFKDQRGITHVFLIAALATLVVAGVGFAGWKVYERRNSNEASAATSSIIGGSTGVSFRGCRVYVSKDTYSVRLYTSSKGGSTKIYTMNNTLIRSYTNPGSTSFTTSSTGFIYDVSGIRGSNSVAGLTYC